MKQRGLGNEKFVDIYYTYVRYQTRQEQCYICKAKKMMVITYNNIEGNIYNKKKNI